MTRRQIYFYKEESETYYLSPEFNGDRSEMLRFGMADSCDKDWDDILKEFSTVCTLDGFMKAIAQVNSYYHSSIPGQLLGTRIHILHHPPEIKDETYAVFSGTPGIVKDYDLSICS